MTDFSKLSDEELKALYLKNTAAAPAAPEPSFLDSMELGAKKRAAGLFELGLNTADAVGLDVAGPKEDLAGLQRQYEAQGKDTGVKGLVGELAGDPLTYLPIAGGAKNIAAGIAGSGMLSGLTSGTGDANSTLADQNLNAGISGILSGLLGEGAEKLASPLAKTENLGADDVKEMATAAYQKATDTGGVLRRTVTNRWLDEAQKAIPLTKAGKIVGGSDEVTKLTERLAGLRDKPLKLDEVQEIDELLGDTVDSLTDRGMMTKKARKVLDIQTKFRQSVESAGPKDQLGGREGFEALKEGRQLWSQSVKLRDIEKIITRADMSDNPATVIKSGFRTLCNNPARMKGFTKDERELIKQAAKSGFVGDTLRTMGSRLLPIVSVGSGGGFGAGAASQAASVAARGAATRLQVGRAEKVAGATSDKVRASQGMGRGIGDAVAGVFGQMGGRAAIEAGKDRFTQDGPTQDVRSLSDDELRTLYQQRQAKTAMPKEAPAKSQLTFADTVISLESGGNVNAKAKTSSARGPGQFTDSTWNALGLDPKKRTDLATNKQAIRMLDQKNRTAAEKILKRKLDEGDRYVLHFAGLKDGTKLLSADPAIIAARVVSPGAAKANRAIYFDQTNPKKPRARTVQEVRDRLKGKFQLARAG